MDLFEGLPEQVKKNIVERSKGILESDEPCELHPRYMKMLLPDDRLVCPVCYREERDGEVRQAKSREYYENSVIGKREYLYNESIVASRNILHKGLRDFYARDAKEKELLKEAKLLTHDVAASDPMTIYFQGIPGSGKTHLAMALMQNANALANGKRFLFVNFPTLQQQIRASYDKSFSDTLTESDYIRLMIECDVLAIDDIGSEINPLTMQGRVSDFSDRILYNVMEGRAERKPTILTSNISWNDLQVLLDPKVISRMSYRLKIISFDGVTDKRKDRTITEKKER